MKYLIIYDLDGTLLNSESMLSDQTIKNIQELKKDHIVCINTGRPLRHAIDIYNKLNLDTLMGNYNGTKISLPIDPCFNTTEFKMPNNEILNLCKDLDDIIENIMLEVGEFVYLKAFNKAYQHWCDCGYEITNVIDLEHDFNGAVGHVKCENSKALKEYFLNNDLEIGLRIWHEEIPIENESVCLFELYSKKYDKGSAVDYFKKHYHGQFDKVITVGDSSNDVAMFLKSDIKIVMDNAADEIKEHANIIAPNNDLDGATNAVIKLIKDNQ